MKFLQKIKQQQQEKREEKERASQEELRIQQQQVADRKIYMAQLKEDFMNCEIRTSHCSALLTKNEEAIMELPASLVEGRAVRTGGYAGTRVRIAKGVSVNVGGYKGESHQELRVVDEGTLILTTKKLVFVGEKKTSTIRLNKIISVDVHNSIPPAIAIAKENVQKIQYFFTAEGSLPLEANNRKYNEPLSGEILKWAIVGAVSNY